MNSEKLCRKHRQVFPQSGFYLTISLRRAYPIRNSLETLYAVPSERTYDLPPFTIGVLVQMEGFTLYVAIRKMPTASFRDFDFTVPIWRIGRALDYAATIRSLLGENLEFIFSTMYTGLGGRALFNTDYIRYFRPSRKTFLAKNQDMALETLSLSPTTSGRQSRRNRIQSSPPTIRSVQLF